MQPPIAQNARHSASRIFCRHRHIVVTMTTAVNISNPININIVVKYLMTARELAITCHCLLCHLRTLCTVGISFNVPVKVIIQYTIYNTNIIYTKR